jgi:hypothetical protein
MCSHVHAYVGYSVCLRETGLGLLRGVRTERIIFWTEVDRWRAIRENCLLVSRFHDYNSSTF